MRALHSLEVTNALRWGMRTMTRLVLLACVGSALLVGCDDDEDTEADRLGVGAQCTSTDQCDEETNQQCLMQFKGGYCGIQGCLYDSDCPEASACIAHTDLQNYCFRTCA